MDGDISAIKEKKEKFEKKGKELEETMKIKKEDFKGMKTKKMKKPTGCTSESDCNKLCENIVNKNGVNLDNLGNGGAKEEEVDGENMVAEMEETSTRILSDGGVVFSPNGYEVDNVVDDMTIEEVSDNPGNINIDDIFGLVNSFSFILGVFLFVACIWN